MVLEFLSAIHSFLQKVQICFKTFFLHISVVFFYFVYFIHLCSHTTTTKKQPARQVARWCLLRILLCSHMRFFSLVPPYSERPEELRSSQCQVIMFTSFYHLHIDSLHKYLYLQHSLLNLILPCSTHTHTCSGIHTRVESVICLWPPKLLLFFLLLSYKNESDHTQKEANAQFCLLHTGLWTRWMGITQRTLPETFRLTPVPYPASISVCVCLCTATPVCLREKVCDEHECPLKCNSAFQKSATQSTF